MAILVPKLSAALLQKEVARIRDQKKATGGSDLPPIRYFNFVTGSNRIRILPPSLKELVEGVAMLVYRHWQLPGDKEKEVCISATYPNCGASCPIDAVLAKHKEAGTDVWSWNPSGKGITNILDRKEEGKLAQLCELPMSVYNWLVASIVDEGMMDSFYDPKKGVDLIVVKSVTKGEKGKEKTEYKPSWSPKGPSAIAAEPKKLKAILESCYEVGEIYRPFDPKSDWGKKTLSRLKATANALDRRLLERAGEESQQSKFDDDSAEESEESAITSNPSDKPPCFGHSHADKRVEYDEVKGGYNPDEYRCVMCSEQLPCSTLVLEKFPSHYNDDGSEIVLVSIKPAGKKTPPPPPKKSAKKSAPPPKKAVKKGKR